MGAMTKPRIEMNDCYDELFGEAGGMVTPDGRRWPKYKLPVIGKIENGTMEVLLCGRSVYEAIANMLTEPSYPASVELEGAGFRVRITRSGHGIETRFNVCYVPDNVPIIQQGWTWRGIMAAASIGAAIGSAVVYFLI